MFILKQNGKTTYISLHRHEIYDKNPLVNVACIGIVKRDNIIYGNALNEGSLLVLCGAKQKRSTYRLDKLQKNKTIGMKNIMLVLSLFSTQSAIATPNKRLDP